MVDPVDAGRAACPHIFVDVSVQIPRLALGPLVSRPRLQSIWLPLLDGCTTVVRAGIGVGGIEKDANGVMILDTSVSLEHTWRDMEALVDAGKARSIGVRSAQKARWAPQILALGHWLLGTNPSA